MNTIVLHLLRVATLYTLALATQSSAASQDADTDWLRRSTAPGVVVAVGFDDIRDWAKYSWDRGNCNPAYQINLNGTKAGCRDNAWDANVRASGKGSVRFDILAQTAQGSGGNIVIPFGDDESSYFGANSEFWVSWRQRMDKRFIAGYKAQGNGFANAKQVIIAQGDVRAVDGKKIPANACSEAQVVIVSSTPGTKTTYPIGYIECARYRGFEDVLKPGSYVGNAMGSTPITRQNMRTNPRGQSTCIAHPNTLDQTGCFTYLPDKWITYMVHLKLGPEGKAFSSVSRQEQPGYINSTYELYGAYPGEDFQPIHRQTGIVIPKGQYYQSGDLALASSYKSGWGPGDANPNAKFGKLWLLPYMTNKDPTEITPTSSTWFDEVIVSRCQIAAPGKPIPKECKPPTPPAPSEARTSLASAPSVASTQTAVPVPRKDAAELPKQSQIPAPETNFPKEAKSGLTGFQILNAIQTLQPGHWLEIPRSEMVRVQVDACKSPAIQKTYDRIGNGTTGCNPDIVMAYSGGAYDTRKHRLIVWGGGHSGYAGNEIYAFELTEGKWSRITEPTPPLLEGEYDKETKRFSPITPYWHDPAYPPTPISVHSYDQLEYLPEQNMLFAAGGATFSGNGYATSLTWLFDLSKNDPSGWQQADPIPGKAYGLYEYNMSTAYDPMIKKIIMRGYTKSGIFDPLTKKWTVSNSGLLSRRLGSVGELDPKRRKLVVIGGGSSELYDVGKEGELGPLQVLASTGDKEIEQCYAPGLVYDSRADRFVAWCGKGDVYTLNLENRNWKRHSGKGDALPGDPDHTPGIRGTWGRFRYMPEYNAYIVVNGNRQNIFLYRLADEKGNIAP